MIPKPKRINKFVAKFVIKTLTTISREPEYESLNEMIQSLYANAVTLKTTPDVGKHGHVGLILKDTLYTTLLMVTPWKYPNDPVSIPTMTKNATVAHRQKSNKIYGKARQIFKNTATMG